MNPPDQNDVSTANTIVNENVRMKTKNSIWEISDKGRKWLATVKSV